MSANMFLGRLVTLELSTPLLCINSRFLMMLRLLRCAPSLKTDEMVIPSMTQIIKKLVMSQCEFG